MNEEFNYELLLDIWAEKCFSESDKAIEKMEYCEVGSYKYGYNKGYSDGLRWAVTFLNMFERKLK